MATKLKKKISDFKEKGLIKPSSEALAKKIVKTADIKNRKFIVEFGPGTGVFTKEILKAKSKDAIYFAIELDANFVKDTKSACPDATVYHDSATNLGKYLKEHGVEQCDCIISGLPFANFDDGLQNEILETAYNNLSKDGVFLTFAYHIGLLTKAGQLFRKKLPTFFSSVNQTNTVWGNLPPAFIYHAVK